LTRLQCHPRIRLVKRFFAIFLFLCSPSILQAGDDKADALAVSQFLAQGDTFVSEKNYERALEAYRHADELAHHASVACYLRIIRAQRGLGDLEAALQTAKNAVAAAGSDRPLAARTHLIRGAILVSMAAEPGDKKLRDAEQEFREALALDPAQVVGRKNLGITLIREGREPEGIAELKAYMASPNLDPGSIEETQEIIANPVRAIHPFAPEFSFATLEGARMSNAALQGKVVLLDFWGTWCPPCRASVPVLQTLHRKFATQPFELVGVSSDDNESVWKSFIAANHMNWREYLDLTGEVQLQFEIDSFPTYIVFDKEGVILFRQSGLGESTQHELEDVIEKALRRPYTPHQVYANSSAPAASSAAPDSSLPSSASANPAASAVSPPVAALKPGAQYHNGSLGFIYHYPEGWIAAKTEAIRAANDQAKALAKNDTRQDSSTPRNTGYFSVREMLFYATKREENAFAAVPSIRINAFESPGAALTIEYMQFNATAMARTGLRQLREPGKIIVDDQALFRVDFEDDREASHVLLTQFQTVVEDHVLTIEFRAASPQELDQLAATIQTCTFSDADKK
jgi:thiol-disulfide isomerase/thioredoxin